MRHLTLAAALSLSTCLSAPLAAQSTATAPMELTFERVFASPGLDGPTPRAVKLSPDGRYLTVLRNREDDRERYDLWAFDREAGQWAMLVDSKALGTTVAVGSGPQALLRQEQIEFLADQPRSLLLAELGFEESTNNAYLSDIRLQMN